MPSKQVHSKASVLASPNRRLEDAYEDDLNALVKVIEALSLEMDFEKVCDSSTQVAMQIVSADICGLALPAGESCLSYQFNWGLPAGIDEGPLRAPFSVTTGAASTVFKDGKGAFFAEYETYAHAIPAIAALGVRSVFAAPIVAAGEIVGVLSIAWYQHVPHPPQNKIVLLEVVLRQIGIAYHRHQLIKKLSQSEAQAKASSERLQRVLTVSPVVMYNVKVDLQAPIDDPAVPPENIQLDFISENVQGLVGYTPEEVYRHPNLWFEIVHPEDLPRIALTNNPEAVTRGDFNRTYRIRHKDGHYIWIQDSLRIYNNRDGLELEVAGGWMDITERKNAEFALSEAEAKYRGLVEQSMVGIYIIQDGKFTYVNPKLAEIFGYTMTELDAKPVLDLVYSGDHDTVRETMRQRLAGGGPQRPYMLRGVCKDGKVVDIEAQGALILIGDKPAIMGLGVDITERKRAENALHEAETKYRSLIEQSMVGVYIVQDNRFTYVNPKLAQIFGYTQEELYAAKSIFEYVPDEYQSLVQENFRKRLSGELKSVQYSFKVRRKDNVVVDVEAHGSVTELNGAPAIIGMGFDITDRKAAEAELLRHRAHLEELVSEQTADLTAAKTVAENAKEEAELANQAKSRLLASASHDLRQPMHALGLLVAALRRRVQFNDAETEKIMRYIEASVETMDSLFNALLDISKLDAGIIKPMLSAYPVNLLLERLKGEFAEETSQKGLRLKVHACNRVVRCDPALLERILRNFISNAVRYTVSGGVLVGCRTRGKWLELQVWDTGPGIPPESQREIFQEFYQLNNLERDRTKGLGLGLAIVDRLARLLGYTIKVASKLKAGTMFSVLVPLEEQADTTPQATPLKVLSQFPGAKVVVVDDEIINAEAMRTLLQEWGCLVTTAVSGEHALAQLTDLTQPPDLIISDYRLRDLETGAELIYKLRRHFHRAIPGILVTGDTTSEVLKQAEASGFRLLHKPVMPPKLRALMAYLMSDGEPPNSPQ